MIAIAKVCSLLALGIVLAPCMLFVLGSVQLSSAQMAVLAGTILWFLATPVWMVGKLPPDADQVEI